MKKVLLLAISLLLAGCANVATPTTEPAAQNDTSMAVPAPGFEDVDEMVVEDDPAVSGPSQGSAGEASKPQAANENAEVKTFEISAFQFGFEPSTITVNQGDAVQLNITSEDVEHGFALAEFDVSETIAPGQTVTVEFVADRAGTFRFFCNVYCGQGHGSMNGQLIVE